jgi:hypothetical protein
MRSLKPDRLTFDNGDTHWRGAVLWDLGPVESVIRFHAELSLIRDQVVTTAVIPVAAQSLGCPLCVRVDGDTYQIVEVRGSHAGRDAPSDNARAVIDGRFCPGVVLPAITGEAGDAAWWW